MTNKQIPPHLTGEAIRKTFIDYFTENAHTFVPSSSLVPGGDATLLFSNSGMVQFKDIFLGTDKRPYTRAVNSQKCMRVAGKHNDLDDVGRDDTHHTFFEMLGNWSFGDYYKKEAIEWAWHLLTEVWGLSKESLYATVFEDEKGQIPSDHEAAEYWRAQPGINPKHVFYLGRKDNFWEMANTGPCGPCSEIHIDLRPDDPEPVTPETLDTDRFLELWNLVFIQYNRTGETTFLPLPATHVDTGMGFERIVAVLQGVDSNYRTDLLWPIIERTAELTGHDEAQIDAHFTPYRVIADHARAAAFLVADGVIPGNLGRNYITRMIIRRAYRFGGKIGLTEPFMAQVADVVIENYSDAYPELRRNRASILRYITREEEQFQRTLDKATVQLDTLLDGLETAGKTTLPGRQAADLYTTYGMPLEITRDIARERGLEVDEAGYREAIDAHRIASGKGSSMGALGGDDAEMYAQLLEHLQTAGNLDDAGVTYDPYGELSADGEALALVQNGQPVDSAAEGEEVEIMLPTTPFYIESGGQVADTGTIVGAGWRIAVEGVRRPAAGVVVHVGKVLEGRPQVGDTAQALVDAPRRHDIMRNHTATHLLHTALRAVLGGQPRQAGSLVAPDRLRFDFTHPEAVTLEQVEEIETFVNQRILENYPLNIVHKPLQQALDEGATALFGEKYSETVRTITISDFSYELCGGTHVPETNDIGLFIVTSEGSAAAGIRRIEAITGRAAYAQIQQRRRLLNAAARTLGASPEQVMEKAQTLLANLSAAQKEIAGLRANMAAIEFNRVLDDTHAVSGVDVLTIRLKNADANTLRQMADRFRERHPANGVAVLATVTKGKPLVIAAVTKDLTGRGLHAGKLVKFVAQQLGGGGGGKPTLAQAGGRDASKLDEALASVPGWVEKTVGSG